LIVVADSPTDTVTAVLSLAGQRRRRVSVVSRVRAGLGVV